MKRLILVCLLLVISCYLFSNIETDKAIHFTGITGLYILSDIVCEWTNTPRYIPFVLCIGISLGKEFNDPVFNWEDIRADSLGLVFGFSIRFMDLKQGRKG